MSFRQIGLFAAVTVAALLSSSLLLAVEPLPSLHLPETPYRYDRSETLAHWQTAEIAGYDTTPNSNRLTDAGATLGRVLFYDQRLSGNGTISCASCHVQQHGFSDPRRFSVGFDGQSTDRNSMPLHDLRHVRAGFFWDERAATLEEAVLTPMYSQVEMGSTPDHMLTVIQADTRYVRLFQEAFGSPEISERRVAQALSQFIRAIAPRNSKYDLGAAQADSNDADFPNFTAAENRGKAIFQKNCALCHTRGTQQPTALFIMFRSLNNGIDATADARDGGRGDITLNPEDVGLFKASSLRNIEYTAPYMHDGRFSTLEETVRHYSEGVRRHPTLSAVRRMPMTPQEQADLVAFLKTLSDSSLLTDPRFANPWQEPEAKFVSSNSLESPSNVDDAAARLAKGQGLLPGQAATWLHTLDINGDDALSLEEAGPVVEMLLRTSTVTSMPVPDESPRRPGRRDRSPGDSADAAADWDGDGNISPEEERQYEALRRVILFGDGNRLEVFLDRIIVPLQLSVDAGREVRQIVRQAKQVLNEKTAHHDAATLEHLETLLGAEQMQEFRQRVVDVQNGLVQGELPEPPTREMARGKVAAFDRNGDQQLDRQELSRLVAALETFPGGFGQMPASRVDIRQYTRRILAFDQDGDNAVSVQELPERMHGFAQDGDTDRDGRLTLGEATAHFQQAAFRQVVSEGIYIGGAFDNTLSRSEPLLEDLDLAESSRTAAREILTSHKSDLKHRGEETLRQVLVELQQALAAQEGGQ